MRKGLPFQLEHYLELAGWSGRYLDPRKCGSINENAPHTRTLGYTTKTLVVSQS
ncbi:hypothetical protein ACG1BZ_13360 [Microbulbifer sp. CNSA002]|uniref:hypothetical protein n=1 Tax=unclassified Microbulbifer TaxID=2619833 RepID=UPI0039B3B254